MTDGVLLLQRIWLVCIQNAKNQAGLFRFTPFSDREIMLQKSFKLSILAGAFVATAFGAVAPTASAQTINAVMHAPLRALDPVISFAYISRNYGYMVYDTLLARDAQDRVQPQMADWKASADGKTYTFTLRQGLKWHDGKAVNAEDCVASIKRFAQVDKLGALMTSMMVGMKVTGENTFEMSFKVPTDIALKALSKPSSVAAFMMPASVAAAPSSEPITSSIGSGPFKFVAAEYKPGVQAVFEKNKDYVPRAEPASGQAGGKVVKVDRVKWVSMPDPMTAVNALMSGEVDFIENTPKDLVSMLDKNPDYTLSAYNQQYTVNLVRLNHTQAPFNNLKVRQAAMLALGQKPLLEAQTGNTKQYATCAALFACGTTYGSEYGKDMVIEAQPEKAKALLKEAGYNNEPVIVMHATDITEHIPTGPIFAQQLRQAGFNVQLQSMDWATVVARRNSKSPATAGGWSVFYTWQVKADVQEPLGYVGAAAGGDSAWFGWPNVPAIEAARTKLASTADLAEGKKIAAEIQKLAIDNVVTIPMGEFPMITAKRKVLANQVDGAVPAFWNMTKSGK
jgi:peptide/nickel transport system substrate-binding protein